MKRLTQKDKLLNALKDAGTIGVNSFHARQIAGLQAPVRVQELQELGYQISSTKNGDKSVTYRLVGIPDHARPFHYEYKDNTAFKVFD